MLNLIKTRIKQGHQAIDDVRAASLDLAFRGLPKINDGKCPDECGCCRSVCTTGAIELKPVRLDMGKCIFCGDCKINAVRKVVFDVLNR